MLEPHLKHSEEFQKDGTHSKVFDKLGNGLVLVTHPQPFSFKKRRE